MKKLLTFVLFIILFLSKPILAEEVLDSLQKQIEDYTQKISELSKAKDTLSNQISYLNSQVELTQLKIQQTQQNIIQLEQEIQELSLKIDKLDVNLNRLSIIFIQNVNQSYKLTKKTPPLIVLLTQKFNQFLDQYKYLKTTQQNNRDLLIQLETVRTNFDIQKTQKAEKQEELSILKSKLDNQQKDLTNQKLAKASLLEITKNDEKRYQQLKAEAERELSSLLAARFVGKRQVKKGEALGIMGNTGYSFGAHLHFGLYELREENISSWSYFNDIDPNQYISQYQWPMSDPIRITQGRGVTQYAYLYGDRFHHGIDLVSPIKTIYSVNDGVAYFFRNPSSSLGNHVKLFHPDGKMTLYLHME